MRVQKKLRKGCTWCGPAAMTVITGQSYETCENAVKQITGRDIIRSMNDLEMHAALSKLGVTLVSLDRFWASGEPVKNFPTFNQWLRAGILHSRVYLIAFLTHFVVVSNGKMFDPSYPDGVPLDKAPYKRRRIETTYKAIDRQS